MVIMYKAFKFRLYPNDEQRIIINKIFGCQRFVYNHYLNDIKNNGYKSARTCINDYNKNLKHQNDFLQETDNTPIIKTIFRLEENYNKYLNSKFGYPKYKSKYAKNSYTISVSYKRFNEKTYSNIEVNLKEKIIKLPELEEVKIKGYRKLNKKTRGQLSLSALIFFTFSRPQSSPAR